MNKIEEKAFRIVEQAALAMAVPLPGRNGPRVFDGYEPIVSVGPENPGEEEKWQDGWAWNRPFLNTHPWVCMEIQVMYDGPDTVYFLKWSDPDTGAECCLPFLSPVDAAKELVRQYLKMVFNSIVEDASSA